MTDVQSCEAPLGSLSLKDMSFDNEKVQQILNKIPSRYRGPGGAVAVVKDGNIVGQQVWGYADLDRRIPMTPEVVVPICSITKQFVSMLLFELTRNPPATMTDQQTTFQEQTLARLREIIPSSFVDDRGLTVDNLVDMCSGFRDYWALCTLQGSRPDSTYSLTEHNPGMLQRITSLHFEPGTEYSYSNTNFNIVERLIEHVTNVSLESLLAERVFQPAGMKTARMCPRTDRLPAPIIGYEGSERLGFMPAPNFIEWSADAGMAASLADMIAYEKYFDGKYNDAQSEYRKTIQPHNFKNGAPSKYRYGLRHDNIEEYATIGHGGALRGYRLMRRYVPSERLSVVVMFNHAASAPEAATYIVKQILDIPEPPPTSIQPVRDWFGPYLDQDTQLAVRVSPGRPGKVQVLYSRVTDVLKLVSPDRAEGPNAKAWIDGDTIHMERIDENRVLNAKRLTLNPNVSRRPPVQGTYWCSETESTFICEGEGDMLYALFNGCFGHGPPHFMTYIGDDVWVFANPRAMDDQPPGDWTVVFTRDEKENIVKATIGCWLARRLEFVRVQ